MKSTDKVKIEKKRRSGVARKEGSALSPLIIDVRKPDEFAKGHAGRSINIPLQEIPGRLAEIKKIKSPLVVVCGGGTRHVKAFELLKTNGIKCEKGGSWKKMKT